MNRTFTSFAALAAAILLCAPALPAEDNVKIWTGESTFSGPLHSGTATATGTVTRTGEGVTWEAEKQGVVDGEKKWEATTTGSGAKTADGYEWSSTTKGTTEAGKEWTTTRDVDAVKNADGTLTINRDATKTLPDGQTVTRESQTTVTKAEDGKTWTTTGTQTGPKGTATMSGSGSAVKTDEGVSMNISRQGTTAGGSLLRRGKASGYEGQETWQANTVGSGTKTDTGRKWSSSTAGTTEGGQNWQLIRDSETTKSGYSGTLQRKAAANCKSAGTCNQSVTAGGKHGIFKFKKSSSKPAGK
jgi:hypothetical protein